MERVGCSRMIRWRIGLITCIGLILFLSVILRLYQIQVIETRSFSKQEFDLIQLAAEAQSREMILESGRGKILDRHGEVFVGQEKWRVIVFPHTKEQIRLRKTKFQQVSAILHFPIHPLLSKLQSIHHPVFLSYPDRSDLTLTKDQVSKLRALNIPGILVVRSDGRMLQRQVGQQIIGQVIRQPFILEQLYKDELDQGIYTRQSRVGISGIEAAFEKELHGSKEKILHYYHTRHGHPLLGAEAKIVEKKEPKALSPQTIVTTLDKDIQQLAEYILEKNNVIEGAIVVQEIKTGDILAVASTPMGHTVQSERNPWDHRALMEATPGSIFKLLIAIAGLEEGLVSVHSPFYCKGVWEAFHLKDANGKGHGKGTFAQAFAQSCNLYFGSLSKRLGRKKIEKYALQMGFNQKIMWSTKSRKQVPNEHKGMIFSPLTEPKDVGAVVQTGIGQRDVKITPIQAATLVTSLFHQGVTYSPRMITEIRHANGKVMERFPMKKLPHSKKLKKSTSDAVRQMMRETVTHGTASSLRKAKWKLAGKTGTAQVGIKKDRFHKWMVGFGPYEQPRYSVVVLVKSVKNPNDRRATHIFGQVMDALANVEKKRRD